MAGKIPNLNNNINNVFNMAQEIPFESEYELHTLTLKYLNELFGLEIVASEIQLNGLRLDNLTFDEKKQ